LTESNLKCPHHKSKFHKELPMDSQNHSNHPMSSKAFHKIKN
jgi:hypothetical protein